MTINDKCLIQSNNEKFVGNAITNEIDDKYKFIANEFVDLAKANKKHIYKPKFEFSIDLAECSLLYKSLCSYVLT